MIAACAARAPGCYRFAARAVRCAIVPAVSASKSRKKFAASMSSAVQTSANSITSSLRSPVSYLLTNDWGLSSFCAKSCCVTP